MICESLAPKIQGLVPPQVEVQVMKLGLHDYPDRLHRILVEALAGLEREQHWERILMGYGLCANGGLGLKTEQAQLILPNTDDCIGIFLGSRAAYITEHQQEPGTYYLTNGWLRPESGPLAMFEGEHPWTRKYGKEKAEWIARQMMKNFTRVALINTGAYEIEPYKDYARKAAEIFGLKYAALPGTVSWLQQVITGPWDRERLRCCRARGGGCQWDVCVETAAFPQIRGPPKPMKQRQISLGEGWVFSARWIRHLYRPDHIYLASGILKPG